MTAGSEARHAAIGGDGMVRLDHCAIGRIVDVGGVPYFQYKDRNPQSVGIRGTELVRIEWTRLVAEIDAHIASAFDNS